jgi:hypothetical protein
MIDFPYRLARRWPFKGESELSSPCFIIRKKLKELLDPGLHRRAVHL